MSQPLSSTDRILAAIQAANHAQTGVLFEPFRIAVAPPGLFQAIWTNESGAAISFYKYAGGLPAGFRPLGDYAAIGGGAAFGMPGLADFRSPVIPMTEGMLVLALGTADPTALAPPVDFEWILNDHGSRNPQDVSYWRIVPPDGYVALGNCFTAPKPQVGDYWCVKSQYVAPLGTREIFNDGGTHWAADGNLEAPTLDDDLPPPGKVYILPQTSFSHQDICASPQPAHMATSGALCVQQAFLDIPAIDPADPQPAPTDGSGAQTAPGLAKVAILPFTAVADPNLPNRWQASPFYYVAAQPYWRCEWSESIPMGGVETFILTEGVDVTHSSTFEHSTSLTVGAETGCFIGGAEARASVSFTENFSLSQTTTTSNSTSYTDSFSLNLPNAPRAWLYQRHVLISVFRSNLSQLSSIDFACEDRMLLPPVAEAAVPA